MENGMMENVLAWVNVGLVLVLVLVTAWYAMTTTRILREMRKDRRAIALAAGAQMWATLATEGLLAELGYER